MADKKGWVKGLRLVSTASDISDWCKELKHSKALRKWPSRFAGSLRQNKKITLKEMLENQNFIIGLLCRLRRR